MEGIDREQEMERDRDRGNLGRDGERDIVREMEREAVRKGEHK